MVAALGYFQYYKTPKLKFHYLNSFKTFLLQHKCFWLLKMIVQFEQPLEKVTALLWVTPRKLHRIFVPPQSWSAGGEGGLGGGAHYENTTKDFPFRFSFLFFFFMFFSYLF